MLGDDNRRSFPRVDIDCPASVRIDNSGYAEGAIVKNLSGGGFLLWLDRPVEEGSEFEITVAPQTPITPPLSARVRVVRCTPIPESEGSHAVACSILEVLPG
jgi:hypothetical protein